MQHKTLISWFMAMSCCLPVFSQINWQHTNGPEGAASYYLNFDQEYAYYPDAHFLYRSADGQDWEKLPFGNLWPIESYGDVLAAQQGYGFAYDPGGPKFLVSHDHGSTWQEGAMPPLQSPGFTSLAVCTHGIYVADGHQNKIFKTTDEGLTWDFINPPGMYCYDIWAFDNRLYADWNSRFWRLAANGVDWDLVSPPFSPGDHPMSMFASGSLLFFATESNLYCSSDHGATFKKTTIPYHNSQDNFVQLGNRVYKSAGNTTIAYTEDGGASWIEVPNTGGIYFGNTGKAGGTLLLDAYDNGLYRLNETTFDISPAVTGLNSAPTGSFAALGNKLFATTLNGVYAYNLDNGIWTNSTPQPYQSDFRFSQIVASPSGKLACTSKHNPSYFYLSSDSGSTWDKIYPYANMGGFGAVEKIYWFGDVLHVDGFGMGGVSSSDFGQTWSPNPSYFVRIVNFKGKQWAASSSGVYRSDDQGNSWQKIDGPNLLAPNTLFATEDRLFVLGWYSQNHSALYSTEDGVNWQYSNDGLPTVSYSTDPVFYAYDGSVWKHENKYYFQQPSIGWFSSLDTCKTWLPLQRKLRGKLILIDTTFYTGAENGGVFKTGIPQTYGARSSGIVFKDDNNNGQREPGEQALPNVRINLTEPGIYRNFWFVSTKDNGEYSIASTANSADTLRPLIPTPYLLNINPTMHIVAGNSTGRDFGIHLMPDITDVSIRSQICGKPRPGFPVFASVQFNNDGTLPANGTVSVKLDPQFNITHVSPPPSSIIGTDSLVWDFSVALFEIQRISIFGLLKPTVPLGYPLVTRGKITPSLTDQTPANNTFVDIDTVVGAYDPNEKQVVPAKGLTDAEIKAGRPLTYTILFQNTGTFQADRVRITDQLDTALNWPTLRLVASSHTITGFQLLPGGLLEIVFDSIALPDSNTNEAASHGFVTFSIQRNQTYNPNYKIKNKAAIFFDFNDPIITNTVSTGLATTTVAVLEPNVSSAEQFGLRISPNPAQQFFNVSSEGKLEGAGVVTVFNATGQICARQTFSDLSKPATINTSSFKEGTYLVQMHGKQGIVSGKVVIKH